MTLLISRNRLEEIKNLRKSENRTVSSIKKITSFAVMRIWPNSGMGKGHSFDYLCLNHQDDEEKWYDTYVTAEHLEYAWHVDSLEDAETLCVLMKGRQPNTEFIPFPVVTETVVDHWEEPAPGSFTEQAVFAEHVHSLI